MNLKHQTLAAIRWTAFTFVGRSALQCAQLAVLARLFGPAEFGLMALALAVVAFVQTFSDFGVSSAIIHHQDTTAEQLTSLYWLNLGVGLSLTLGLAACSPLLSRHVFHQPDLQWVLVAISTSILLGATAQQLRITSEKALRFGVLSKIELASALVSAAVAIGWALYRPTVYALVAGMLAGQLVQSVLLWAFASAGWRPSLRFRLGGIRHFLRFGGYVMANNMINNLNMQAGVLVAGAVFPPATLGVYSLPRNVCVSVANMINPVVTRVGLPVMAKVQNDAARLKRIYLQSVRMTASVNAPIYMAMAVFSTDFVLVLFGARWIGAATILSLLAVWGMVRSVGNPVGALLLAVGRADLAFKWNLAVLIVLPPTLWLGTRFGIHGLAATQVGAMTILLIPGWYYLVRPACGATLREYAEAVAVPFVSALIAAGVAFAAVYAIESVWTRLSLGLALGTITYVAVSAWLNREWLQAMRDLLASKG